MTTTDDEAGTTTHDEAALARLSQLTDIVTPMAIRVVATLRVPDLLAAGPASLDQLATQVDAQPIALGQVLRHLVNHGFFREDSTGIFTLTDLARPLVSDHPSGLRAWLTLDGPMGRSDMAFAHMLDSVRTGEPAYARMFDRPLWEDFDAHPGLRSAFDSLMSAELVDMATDIARAYDWSDIDHVVDVGGGDGTQLAAIVRAKATMRGTVVEQAGTAETARGNLAGLGLADRCDVTVGNFFETLPSGGDAYLLSVILHDWNDDAAARILRRCADAAGKHGRVLIVEYLAGVDDAPAVTSLDLRMLVTLGGRERTRADFRDLADSAGLTVSRVLPTDSPRSLIECVTA